MPTSDIIPWTIRNKYYSADVHFHLVEFAHWNPQSALRVPAIIFVWTRGQVSISLGLSLISDPVHPIFFPLQPYAEHVFALQNGLARFEPEVTLAIALGREPPHRDDPPEGPDSFFADHGFEYIDGERTHRPEMPSASATEEDDGGGGNDDDVPGLPRVIDALSTIMWPTMVRERDNNGGGKRKSQLRPSLVDFDDVLPGEEETLAALMEADAADVGVPLTRAGRMHREMQALERWLIENEEMHEAEFGRTGTDDEDDADAGEDDHEEEGGVDDDGDGDAPHSLQVPVPDIRAPSGDDPWAAASSASKAPPSTAPHSTATPSSGFDDDFSAVISAPPALPGPFPGPVCGLATASIAALRAMPPPASHHPYTLSPTLLKPSHTGGSFRSLRSTVSDVDIGDEVGYGYEALDDRSSLNFSPEHEHGRMRVFDDDSDPRTSTSRQFGGQTAGLGDEPFDLTNILGTLQTMREDMAGIENEEERRATTARFASEFVFKRMGMDEEEREKIEG